MKRAVLLHGTDSSPSEHWFPWLRSYLEQKDYNVFAPLLPNNIKPNKHIYEEFLRYSGWDFTDNILVGHSSGATTILNLLHSDWLPPIKACVLAGTFLNQKLTKDADWVLKGQFENLFLDSYDPDIILKKCNKFYFVHGSNDPYCDINDAKELSKKLNGTFVTIKNGHHLGSTSGIVKLPQLTKAFENGRILN